MRQLTRSKRWFYSVTRWPVNLFFMLHYGVRFFGRHNMPDEGGVMVVSNHQSHFDPPLIAAALHRQLNFLARKTLFKFSPFAWLIDYLDAIPLDTNGIGFEGIKECLRRLRRGEMVLIFPEGARCFDGQIAEFMPGSLTLAQRAKAAILPVAIDGCYDAWPRTQRFPRLWGRIRVNVGKPILYTDIQNLSEQELREMVRLCVTRLHEELLAKPKQ